MLWFADCMGRSMLPISRILYPVDFSERCSEMLPYVALIAKKYHSEITLLHVTNPVISVPETGIWPPTDLPLPEWLISQQAEKLDSFGRKELDGFPVRRLVYEGEPEAQIVATAKAEDMQLVIMPTHGYGRFHKFLIGSTTAKVLHDLDCPVMTGAHVKRSGELEQRGITNVVCAIDLGPTSCDVLTWAARITSDFNACLSVIHAVPHPEPSLKVVFSSDLKDEIETKIRSDIEGIKSSVGVGKVTICIEEGAVARTVFSYASSVGADLLVVGRGGTPTEFGHLREHAYSIIRESGCVVLSV